MSTKTCQACHSEFAPKYKDHKYCSRSCSARINNSKFPKRKKTLPKGDKIRKRMSSEDWLVGDWNGASPNGSLSQTIRKYLLQKSKGACQLCGFNKVHPSDGKSILEINHKDGDGMNHHPSNLEVICPNCHALTPTYRARNKGRGRPVYYKRVQK